MSSQAFHPQPPRRGIWHRILGLYADSFRGLPRVVWLLCTVLLVNRAGTMVLPFMSLYLTRRLDFTAEQVGLVLIAFGVGSMVGSYLMGRLCKRLGSMRIMQLSLGLGGLSFLAATQLRTFEAWIVGVFILAFFGDGFRPGLMAAVVDAAPAEVRTRSLALVRLAANLGVGIGPAIGGLLASVDYLYLFIGDGLTCLVAGLVLTLAVPAVPHRVATEEELRRRPADASPLTDGPFLILTVAVFLFGCVLFQIFGAYPLYLGDAFGLSERGIGLLLAFNAAIIVIFEMPLVKVLEKRNPFFLVGIGSLLMALGFGLMPLGSSIPFLAFTVVVWTVGEMVSLPFSNSLVATLAGEKSGEYMGIYAATYSAALLLGPATGLWVFERFGGDVLWLLVAAVGPVILGVCLVLEHRHTVGGGASGAAS